MLDAPCFAIATISRSTMLLALDRLMRKCTDGLTPEEPIRRYRSTPSC